MDEKMTEKEKQPMKTSNVELTERAQDPGFWRDLWQRARLMWRLLRDPAVPIYLKLIPVAAVVYLVSPIDIVPDAFLGFGQLDDLGVLLLGIKTFTQMVPQHLIDSHLKAIQAEDSYGGEKITIIDGDDIE